MTQNPTEKALAEAVLKATSEGKPETVNELIQEMRRQFPSVPEKGIIDVIFRLENQNRLRLKQEYPSTTKMTKIQAIFHVRWFWATVSLTLAAVVSVFMIPEDDYPLVIIRYVLGAIFILWLPGYAFIKTLFPSQLPFSAGLKHVLDASQRNLDIIERVVLSFAMSLALVPIVGLLLNYTPWGIRLTPIVLSLATLTLAFAAAALAREYQMARIRSAKTESALA